MATEPILIKPRDLPAAADVYADDAIPTDNGVTVGRGTPVQIVNAGAPVASQSEAIAGVDNAKRMTALRVRQVLDNEIAPAVLRAQAWAESPTNPNPSDPNSKSAKTWAGEAEAAAAESIAAAAERFSSRGDFAAWIATPNVPVAGRTYSADGLLYVGATGATAIPDLPGVIPAPGGRVTPQHYGAKGDGVADDRPAFVALDTTGEVFIPQPPVKYTFSSPLNLSQCAVSVDPGMSWDQLTDNGKLTFYGGRKSAVSETFKAKIHRFSDRVFVGGSSYQYAGNGLGSDAGTSWMSDKDTAPAYLANNASLLSINGGATPGDGTDGNQPYAIVGAVKTSLSGHTSDGQDSIAFGAAVVADAIGKGAWAFIAELQRENNGSQVFGLEVAAKNKADNRTMSPNGQTPGVFGIWLAGGGDDSFGGAATAPSTAGVVFVKNSQTWNTGIVFQRDALTNGRAIALSSEGVGGAHRFDWYNASGNQVFTISSDADAAAGWHLRHTNNGLGILRGSAAMFTASGPDGAVNGIRATGSIAGQAVLFEAVGADTDVNLTLRGKGAGRVVMNTIRLTGLPTSSAGLSVGVVWNDAGTLRIVT